MISTIVVGYVPTPEGETALEYAIAEAELRQAEIIVVNSSRSDAFIDSYKAKQSTLAGIEHRLTDLSIRHQVSSPRGGVDAADHILELSEQYEDTLIILGLRRRSKVGKLLLGSTAQTILTEAQRPVLTVRAAE